MKVTVKIELK